MSELLKRIFFESVAHFRQEERENIAAGVSERNLCARLALALEARAKAVGLIDFFADPEYNRMQDHRVKIIKNRNE